MTVESIARKAGPYEFTEGASYPFYFKIFEKADVYVVVTDDTGVETTIEADTDYRVVMNENQDGDAGGYVTLLKDYTGSKITIGSQVPYDQGVNITNKGGFYPSTLNKAYDKLTILCQQLYEQVSRCIKVNISSGMSADEYKDDLEGLVNQSVSSAASAAASAQQAAADSAQAVSDSATALSRSTTALTQSGTALIQSNTALENSVSAVNSIQPALEAAQQASSDAAEAVEKSNQALAETTAIDDKVEQAVNDAISGVTIPGLTPETIAGALGYTPYNAETNSKDFATNAEVAEAIEAIPEPVNADWNASKGAAAILNKPSTIAGYGIVDAYTKTQVDTKIAEKDCLPTQTGHTGKYLTTDGATASWKAVPEQVNADWNVTSGVAEILNKPGDFTGATTETAGQQGFVPAPSVGDQGKVLKGDGTWGEPDVDKETAAHLAMPADVFTNLTVANYQYYTAPADGYVCAQSNSTGASDQLYISVTGATDNYTLVANSAYGNGFKMVCVPISKGQRFTISPTTTLAFARFIYAQGSQP